MCNMVPVEEDFYLGNPACNGYSAEACYGAGKGAHGAIDPWNGVNALSNNDKCNSNDGTDA